MFTEDLCTHLTSLAEPAYKVFSERIILDGLPILGVRMGPLRTIARQLARSNVPFGHPAEDCYHEQRMIRALVIAYTAMSEEKRIACLEDFLPYINNWAICDSLCSTLKQARKEPQLYREFIARHLNGTYPYEIRCAVVLMLNHFMQISYLTENLTLLQMVHSDHYYVKMAVAWAIATASLLDPETVEQWMNSSIADEQIRAMAAQKIRDGKRSRSRSSGSGKI
jgi:3-methyladenine DNA glycosylase AlkD